jgi:hypothetical protein
VSLLLNTREFNVRVKSTYSDIQEQEMGVPQEINKKRYHLAFSPEKKRYIKKTTMYFCQNTIQPKKDM